MFLYPHHIDYVVENRDAMVEYLEKNFGMKPDHLGITRNSKVALYDIGKTQIQINEPTNPASGRGKHFAKHGPGVFHVAWAVDNIQKLAQDLIARGNKMQMRGEGGIGKSSAHDYLVCNLDPASTLGVQIQLVGDK